MIEHNGMITLCLVIFSYICESQTFYNLIFYGSTVINVN